ncbi:MAG: aldo/keto reductase [Candidatus Aminicenantes bacterium]
MIVNRLGNTDIHLTAVGLGSWAMGGGGYKYGWGEQDDKNSVSTIHRAIELGINWIDTAPVYGEGRSEEVLGKALKGKRDKVILSTKCGLHMDDKKEKWVFNLKKDSIRFEVEISLKRLQTDVIDLYQMHSPFPEEDIEEAWSTLQELKKEGKIRYAGVSNFNLAHLKRVHPIHPVAFLQPQYNMIDPTIENEILDYCGKNNIGVIAFSPMCRGLLTGNMTKERVENLPEDDNRLTLPFFQEPELSANLKMVEKLHPIAERNNKTLAQLAIAWVLRRPEVTAAIVGARNPSQIEQTAPAGDWVLSEKDKTELDQILNEHHSLLEKLRGD